VPKTNTKPGRWDHDLRRQLKRDNGPGWSVGEQSGRVKLTYRYDKDTRSSVMLDIPWGAGSATAILNEVGVIRARMLEAGIGLRAAHQLNSAVEERITRPGVVVGAVDWEDIAQRFLEKKKGNRKNTIRPTVVRINNALATLKSKPKPTDGESLFRAYAEAHFDRCPPGGEGRKRHLGDVAALLRFAVDKCCAPNRWLAPSAEVIDGLIGDPARDDGEAITPAVKPDALARILDQIEERGDPGLWMAVALVACFGLRPAELAVLSLEEGDLRVGGMVKRNERSKRRSQPPKPRLALALEIPGREDGAKALKLFSSGVNFPVQLATQIEKAKRGEDVLKAVGSKFALYLNTVPAWRELATNKAGITPYSLRHGYAWRAHNAYERPLSIRDTAALMGHSPQTHHRYYGDWTDDEGLRDAVMRAQR